YDRTAGDLPGLSVVHDVPRLIAAAEPVSWRSTELNPLPPMLQALVPPKNADNLQRVLLTRLLEKRGMPHASEVDWHMLLLAGQNGIGHLDVFENDDVGTDFYRGRPTLTPVDLETTPILRLALAAIQPAVAAITLDQLLGAVGNHPTAAGMMPKLLLPIIPPGANARDAQPVQALVKLQNRHYDGVLPLEDLGYLLHQRAGLVVPRRWLFTNDGVTALATERFDRMAVKSGGFRPVPLESLYSGLFVATAGGERPVTTRWSMDGPWPPLELAAQFMAQPVLGATTAPAEDQKRFYLRILIGLLSGNGDLHLENFAFLGARSAARLSPVFDPAPMRAYRLHSMVSSLAFGGLLFGEGAVPVELGPKVIELGARFGLQKRHALAMVGTALEVTRDFPDLVRRTAAPTRVTEALIARVEGVR